MSWDSFRLEHHDELIGQGLVWIGELVRRRRHRVRMTQRRLELVSGVSQSVISRLERGQLRGLRWSRFAKLVGALGGLDEDAPVPPWCHRGAAGLLDRQRLDPWVAANADRSRAWFAERSSKSPSG